MDVLQLLLQNVHFLNIFAHTPVSGATLHLIKVPVHVRTLGRNSLKLNDLISCVTEACSDLSPE